MKRRLPSFFAGMLTMLLICSLTVSALAISGRMTLEVEPINVMVNGEVFQPKDGLGRDVPVFVYRGTTYAPLRALAEAYGLEVGYDKAQNLATVTDPRAAQTSNLVGEEQGYQEFKEMWKIKKKSDEDMKIFTNPVTWIGVEVNPLETDLYYLETPFVEGFNTREFAMYEQRGMHIDYFNNRLQDQTVKYAVQIANELHSEGRNILLVFQVNSTDVYKLIKTANGQVAAEKQA